MPIYFSFALIFCAMVKCSTGSSFISFKPPVMMKKYQKWRCFRTLGWTLLSIGLFVVCSPFFIIIFICCISGCSSYCADKGGGGGGGGVDSEQHGHCNDTAGLNGCGRCRTTVVRVQETQFGSGEQLS